jgi:phosphatidylinositol glycan class M
MKYFLWYMMFLPYYLPDSSLLESPAFGITTLVLWIVNQGAWLQQGFQLEFNGHSTFVPGLWISSILFFVVNVCILGVIINDTKVKSGREVKVSKKRL